MIQYGHVVYYKARYITKQDNNTTKILQFILYDDTSPTAPTVVSVVESLVVVVVSIGCSVETITPAYEQSTRST